MSTYTVTSTSDNATDPNSLRYAINQANNNTGSTININLPQLSTINLSGNLIITASVTINGLAELIVILGAPNNDVFYIIGNRNTNLVLNNLNIGGNFATNAPVGQDGYFAGNCVRVDRINNLTISNCNITGGRGGNADHDSDNQVYKGGAGGNGIYVDEANNISVTDSGIIGGNGGNGGDFRQNGYGGNGGAGGMSMYVLRSNSINITNCDIDGGSGSKGGTGNTSTTGAGVGGIGGAGGNSLVIGQSNIIEINQSSINGGSGGLGGIGSTNQIGGTGGYGGVGGDGILMPQTFNIDNFTITNCEVGGGLGGDGNGEQVNGGRIHGGLGGKGGTAINILDINKILIDTCTITGGEGGEGGNNHGSYTMAGNGGDGGLAINVNNITKIINSTIRGGQGGNSNGISGSGGPGIDTFNMIIDACLVRCGPPGSVGRLGTYNYAITVSGTATVTNCTIVFSLNAIICTTSSTTIAVIGCTITKNSHGISTSENTILYCGNSIVYENDLGDIINVTQQTSLGNNILDQVTNFTTQSTDLNQNPNLQPLTNNGGPTHTMEIKSGSSPNQNASTSIYSDYGITKDQRGIVRKTECNPDIGAFEIAQCICFIGSSLILTKNLFTNEIKELPAKDVYSSQHQVFNTLTRKFEYIIYNIITGITKEFVLIEKDSIRPNYPHIDLYITKYHPVLIDGKEILSQNLPKAKIVEIEPEIIYSICTRTRCPILINGMDVLSWGLFDWNECTEITKITWRNN